MVAQAPTCCWKRLQLLERWQQPISVINPVTTGWQSTDCRENAFSLEHVLFMEYGFLFFFAAQTWISNLRFRLVWAAESLLRHRILIPLIIYMCAAVSSDLSWKTYLKRRNVIQETDIGFSRRCFVHQILTTLCVSFGVRNVLNNWYKWKNSGKSPYLDSISKITHLYCGHRVICVLGFRTNPRCLSWWFGGCRFCFESIFQSVWKFQSEGVWKNLGS